MNNTSILAMNAAEKYLRYAWDMAAVQQAFGEGWPHTLGYALKLFGAYPDGAVVELIMLYDKAGMRKTEMAKAIWAAARAFYDAALYAQASGDGEKEACV